MSKYFISVVSHELYKSVCLFQLPGGQPFADVSPKTMSATHSSHLFLTYQSEHLKTGLSCCMSVFFISLLYDC